MKPKQYTSAVKLSVLEWAQERLGNSLRLAAELPIDRDGWLEDAGYWREIIALIVRAHSGEVE